MVTVGRSLIHLFAADGGAQSIATISLTSYSEAAAATVVHIFALWGLAQLLMGFVYVVVAWRYQALIPFMYALLLLEYAMRIVVGRMKPVVLLGTAPGAVGNYVLVPVLIVMLALATQRSGAVQHETDDKEPQM